MREGIVGLIAARPSGMRATAGRVPVTAGRRLAAERDAIASGNMDRRLVSACTVCKRVERRGRKASGLPARTQKIAGLPATEQVRSARQRVPLVSACIPIDRSHRLHTRTQDENPFHVVDLPARHAAGLRGRRAQERPRQTDNHSPVHRTDPDAEGGAQRPAYRRLVPGAEGRWHDGDPANRRQPRHHRHRRDQRRDRRCAGCEQGQVCVQPALQRASGYMQWGRMPS